MQPKKSGRVQADMFRSHGAFGGISIMGTSLSMSERGVHLPQASHGYDTNHPASKCNRNQRRVQFPAHRSLPSAGKSGRTRRQIKTKKKKVTVGSKSPIGLPELPSPKHEDRGFGNPDAVSLRAPSLFTGDVVVRYSHYHEKFPCSKGRLMWNTIDEQYAISFVFRGNFDPRLEATVSSDIAEKEGTADEIRVLYRDQDGAFSGIQGGCEYDLIVTEDPEAGVGVDGVTKRDYVYNAGRAGSGLSQPNRAVEDLTSQLRALPTKDLVEAGAHYQQLREARDLEDILYSGL